MLVKWGKHIFYHLSEGKILFVLSLNLIKLFMTDMSGYQICSVGCFFVSVHRVAV